MNHDVEGEGSAVIHQLDAGIGYSLMHLDADVEALHRGGEGVHIGLDHLFLVFREHLHEVAQVRERHVHFRGLAGHDAVFAFYIGHNFLSL